MTEPPFRQLQVDLDRREVTVTGADGAAVHPLDSPEALALVSSAWTRVSWEARYSYTFTWLGRPIIQIPDDLFRLQEVIFSVRPDVIIETGVAHGGSLVFYASLCQAMGHGKVIGVDILIRPENRAAIAAHPLASLITLIEADSTSSVALDQVQRAVRGSTRGLVILDGNHARAHVLAELEAYARFVGIGSYLLAADGIMADLTGSPRAGDDWSWNNPRAAAADFAARHPEFAAGPPPWLFNESSGLIAGSGPTQFGGGWLRRIGSGAVGQ
jgi:cephalosporin hydroxylase